VPVYLHELVNTVPARTEEYLDSMAEHQGTSATRAGKKDTMLGLWSVIEAVGAWPLAVNIWQYGSWDDSAANLARQFEPKTQDPALKAWWLANLDLRTGGFDRLIESTDYTSDVAALRAAAVGGKLFLHQIVNVLPGRVDEYLAAYGRDGVVAAQGEGAQFVGAYRVRMRNHEAILLLAFRDPADLARYQEAWHDPLGRTPLRKWRAFEDRWVRGKASLLMKPRYFLTSPWHP
jgi:hypothetical protein